MKIVSKDNNALEECVSLTADFGQMPSDSIELNYIPEVRFGQQTISESRWSFTIELTDATVVVNHSNCSIVKESRYADNSDVDELEITTTETLGKEHVREMTLGGKAKPTSAEASSGISTKNKQTETTVKEAKATQQRSTVQCVAPGNQWRIRCVDDALSGLYIGSDTLCVLEAEEETGTIDTTVLTSKQNLQTNVLEQGLITRRRKKMIEIVVAKSLGVDPDTGKIRMCHSHTDWSID